MKPGEKLAVARKFAAPALGQKELARLLAVDTSSVGRWECTGHIPGSRIASAAQAVGVPVDWLLDGVDSLPPRHQSALRDPGPESDPSSSARIDEVLLATLRGVIDAEGECEFLDSDSPELSPAPYFCAGNDPANLILCIASGASLFPRIRNGEKLVVRLDRNPPNNSIVLGKRPDGSNFVKVLRQNDRGLLDLDSLNPEFAGIGSLEGWELRGYAVAVLHSYEPGQANIEWDDGRPLKSV